MTPSAYTAELKSGVTQQSWARTQKAGLRTTCSGIRAEIPDAAPTTSATSMWVVITAERITLDRDGAPIGRNSITQTRQLTQDSTGRWLVDEQVQAG